MEDDEVIEAMTEMRGGCVAALVPAVFGAHRGSPGLRFLQSAEAAAAASPADARALCQQLGGATHSADFLPSSALLPRPTASAERASCGRRGRGEALERAGPRGALRGEKRSGAQGVHSNPLGFF